MFTVRPLIGYFLPMALVGLTLFTSEALGQKPSVERVAYTPPTLSLLASTTLLTACTGDVGQAQVVHLDARATSPNVNPIRYNWRTNGGHIEGNGPTVTWDLAGLKPGYYRAYVQMDTGNPDDACEAFASTAVLVRCSPPPPPVCPNVSISCPENVAIDEPITFTANLAGGSGNVVPAYTWRVSAGRIIAGQGTTSITVDTKGLAGQTVKADFSMSGYPHDCSASCVAQIPIPKSTCQKFDEFPDLPRNDEKARLDNFAVALQSDPTSTAYVIVHPGARGRAGEVQKHNSRIVDYLVNSRALDARRIVTIVGASREELMIELVVCPQAAILPKPGQ